MPVLTSRGVRLQCKETVRGEGRYGSFNRRQCSKPPLANGFCKVHDPERKAAEQDERDRAAKAKYSKQAELRGIFESSLGISINEIAGKPGWFGVHMEMNELQIKQLALELNGLPSLRLSIRAIDPNRIPGTPEKV